MLAPVQLRLPTTCQPHRHPLRPRDGALRPLLLLPAVALGLRSARRAVPLGAEVLKTLHPVLSEAVHSVLEDDTETLMIGAKEEIGGVKGLAPNAAGGPEALRQMAPESYDLVVEVRSEELLCGSSRACQNRFYPLGGHEFSLAKDLIINLASILKVLRPGGRFLFLSRQPKGATVPFGFFSLPHLRWRLEEVGTGDATAWRVGLNAFEINQNPWKSMD